MQLIVLEYQTLQKNYVLLQEENQLLYDLNARLKKQIKYKYITNGIMVGSISVNISLLSLFVGYIVIVTNTQ
jgi:hypothetical protein